MDPFTEKLLERTRARRENLQKKMAERPNAVNRPMAKRSREPLTETNSVLSEPVIDKASRPSSKPSPSKRRCSGETAQSTAEEEENKAPAADPPTDKKPPTGPATIRPASSLERATAEPVVQPVQERLKSLQPEPEEMVTSLYPDPPRSQSATAVAESCPTMPASREEPKETPTPAPITGMRSRLQRLAAQRQYWDNETFDEAPSCAPPSPVKSQLEIPAVTTSTAPSGPLLGRKGRLANLAATISSWEDDLASHPAGCNENEQRPSGTAAASTGTKPSSTYPALASKAASSQPTPNSNKAVYSPVKSGKVIPPSPQKVDVPVVRPLFQGGRGPASPQKISNQGKGFPPSPQKAGPAAAPVSHSPLRNQAPSRGPVLDASPIKPGLTAKPQVTPGPTSLPLGREKLPAGSAATPLQQKATSSTPGVKSFLERFGERCQERANQCTLAAAGAKPVSSTPAVTPSTRLAQERLLAAQATSTTTADLTQRQKLERESELAQIRSRFQKDSNTWKSKGDLADTKKTLEVKEQPPQELPSGNNVAKAQSHNEPTAASADSSHTAPSLTCAGIGLALSPPASTSSPLRRVGPLVPVEKPFDETAEEEEREQKTEEAVVPEVEMNVDQSINSAVINEIFDGALEQSEDGCSGYDDEEEEEDALNISSMSLLTPLAETVASVVQRSPEKRLLTSTPASSFNDKSRTPKPSKFQGACVVRAGSSDSIDALDDGPHNLPYSIDAYRSIRVKETERPQVKQTIVRKEDVGRRAEEPGDSSLVSIKQRMKILTNEMNLQQTVIHQASQALNCCTDEEHGKGSPVEAEGQRLLLVATEKRIALKAELDRLKGEGPAGQRKGPGGPSKATEDIGFSVSKGSISLHELRLPLKADFVCSAAKKHESANQYFFIMIRAGAENTVATPLASTRSALSGDALTFTTKFTMSDVSSDFEIDIEVYCLVLKRELPNDKKKKPSKSKAITPKRFLAITKSSQTPVMASPGGPNAVRTSNFVLVGSHKLTLSSIGKNSFPLEKVPFLCPLQGHIYLKMQCQVGTKVEERGFLTMFEDVSGFGAWHRRWCVLSGYCISYWTYPDDERRKNPIGVINLVNCTSRRVEPANREFCARPNTFELITVRPQREGDKETLVSQCQNTMCVTKNWLSADTKDERNLWMRKLNQILVDLRMWQPDSCLRPA